MVAPSNTAFEHGRHESKVDEVTAMDGAFNAKVCF